MVDNSASLHVVNHAMFQWWQRLILRVCYAIGGSDPRGTNELLKD